MHTCMHAEWGLEKPMKNSKKKIFLQWFFDRDISMPSCPLVELVVVRHYCRSACVPLRIFFLLYLRFFDVFQPCISTSSSSSSRTLTISYIDSTTIRVFCTLTIKMICTRFTSIDRLMGTSTIVLHGESPGLYLTLCFSPSSPVLGAGTRHSRPCMQSSCDSRSVRVGVVLVV